MLQHIAEHQNIQNAYCSCFFNDTFASHYLEKSVIKIDSSKLQQCPAAFDFATHLESIKTDISVCTTSFDSASIKVLELLGYSLISTDVVFERYYDDALEPLAFDSDYTIIPADEYAVDIKGIRLQEFAVELARMSHYGKNSALDFDAVHTLYAEKIARAWTNKDTQVFAAVDFVGALSGFISIVEARDEMTIQFLSVHTSIRRKGIAQELIKRVCLYAQEVQKNIVVNIQAENIASVRLYEKAGFIQKSFSLVYHKIKE